MSLFRFLIEKTGNKTRNISKLRNEALAKIPQFVVEDADEGIIEKSSKTVNKSPSSSRSSGSTTTNKRSSSPRHTTTIRLNGSSYELTSILESGPGTAGGGSENDSDSAIILDDSSSMSPTMMGGTATSSSSSSASSTTSFKRIRGHHSKGGNLGNLRRISRSVSDVMAAVANAQDQEQEEGGGSLSDPEYSTVEEEEEVGGGDEPEMEEEEEEEDKSFDSAHYRGFLLRHGSFERFKHRSRLKKKGNEEQQKQAIPSDNKKVNDQQTGAHIHGEAKPGNSGGITKQPSINHRNVTKPRDVKNRSSRAKKFSMPSTTKPSSSSSSSSGVAKSPVSKTSSLGESVKHFVEQHGSVYRSVFLDNADLSHHSFA